MARRFLPLFFLVSSLLRGEEVPTVIVSVAPYKWLVQEISHGAVEVFLIVPPATSAHTFEPTPKDMIKASRAKLWFTLGESFEKKAIAAISASNAEFKTVDLTERVDLIHCDPLHTCSCSCGHHDHGSVDLHVWLSPKELKTQAQTIAKALSALFPGQTFSTAQVESQLDQVDQEIRKIAASKRVSSVLVAHPAFGYFCRDYGFKQLSIEVEGKDPTPRRLNDLVNQVKSLGITKVFAEPQYSDKGAKMIAQEIGARVVTINPYRENVVENLVEIARHFADD